MPTLGPNGRLAESIADLLWVLKSDDGEAQERAAKAVGWLGYRSAAPTLAVLLADISMDYYTRVAAANALGTVGGPRAARALAFLLRNGADVETRELAAIGMQQLGMTHRGRHLPIGILLDTLADPNESVRVLHWIAESLGYAGDQTATEPLIALLRHQSALVRISTVFALGELRDERARPALKCISETDRARVPRLGSLGAEARRAIRKLGTSRVW